MRIHCQGEIKNPRPEVSLAPRRLGSPSVERFGIVSRNNTGREGRVGDEERPQIPWVAAGVGTESVGI